MKILATLIMHPLRSVSGGVKAGRELSIATAALVDLDIAAMAAEDGPMPPSEGGGRYVASPNPLDVLGRFAPRQLRILTYDTNIPALIRDGDYDLVHIHNLFPPRAARSVIAACRAKGIPYVVSTHGFFEMQHYAEINRFTGIKAALARTFVEAPFRRMVAGADGLFALSDCERSLLHTLGVPDERIHVVTNGVNEFYLDPPTDEERTDTLDKFGLVEDVPVLLFMGSIHAYKGIDVFLKSLGGVAGPFQVVVAGGFKDKAQPAALLREAGLAPEVAARVRFTDRVTDEELRVLYNRADVFVYPTRGDTLPLVVIEALAGGCPVVSTTVGGVPCMVTPEVGHVVPPDDAGAVTRAVNDLLADPDKRRAMGAAARQRVEATYRWAINAEAAVEGYRRVLARS